MSRPVPRTTQKERALLTCFTCGAPIVTGLLRKSRRFCNTGCGNAYKGLRNTYRKAPKVRDDVWPFGDSEDPLVKAVNAAIPRTLPEQIRSEACQEMAVGLLLGERADAAVYVARARHGYQFSSKDLSLELPPPGSPTQIPLRDRL